MEIAHSILVPLLNPNEPEALLVSIFVENGDWVESGQVICTLETTKSAADLTAEIGGYVAGLRFHPGEIVQAGNILCYLADTPDWQLPEPTVSANDEKLQERLPEGLRITQPALSFARLHHLDLSRLPVGPLVTERMVRELVSGPFTSASSPAEGSAFDPTRIIVYGGGGHGKALIDLLRLLGIYQIAGVIDDGMTAGENILGVAVLGGGDQLEQLFERGVRMAVNAVGGIGNIAVRIKVFRRLAQAGFGFPALVHPAAFVESSAFLSAGVQVFPHAYIGSEVKLGFGAIANTSSVISHECSIGDYANISPGALLAGQVQVGEAALVGMGATVNLQVKIGAGARIGNGATVKSDVPENGIVRAGGIWPDERGV
jgi:acetyltransferase EpsM